MEAKHTLLQYLRLFSISHVLLTFFFFFFQAVTVRNSMAKSLYSALFDWIVFRINHALLNSKDLEQNTKVDIHRLYVFLRKLFQ